MEWGFFCSDFDPDLFGLSNGTRPRARRAMYSKEALELSDDPEPDYYASDSSEDFLDVEIYSYSGYERSSRRNYDSSSPDGSVLTDMSVCTITTNDDSTSDYIAPSEAERQRRYEQRLQSIQNQPFWTQRREAWGRAAFQGLLLRRTSSALEHDLVPGRLREIYAQKRRQRKGDLDQQDDSYFKAVFGLDDLQPIRRVIQEQRQRQGAGEFAGPLPHEFYRATSTITNPRKRKLSSFGTRERRIVPVDEELVQRNLIRQVEANIIAYETILHLRGYSARQIEQEVDVMFEYGNELLVDYHDLHDMVIHQEMLKRRMAITPTSSDSEDTDW